MPSTTPVYSGLSPWSRARIMSWPGPRAPRRTPRISTCIGSGFDPVNTVQAVAVSPRGTWLSEKNHPSEGDGTAESAGFWAVTAAGKPSTPTPIPSVANPIRMSFRQDLKSIRVQPAALGLRDADPRAGPFGFNSWTGGRLLRLKQVPALVAVYPVCCLEHRGWPKYDSHDRCFRSSSPVRHASRFDGNAPNGVPHLGSEP